MSEAFNPRRLRLGRDLRGHFLQELAARVGVSSRSVRAWENGTATPSDAHVTRLAEVLAVPRAFLSAVEPPCVPPVLFQSRGRLATGQRNMAMAAGVTARLLDDWITSRAERSVPDLPDLSTLAPEEAAASLRETWSIGDNPVPPLVPLLESHGVRVYSLGHPVTAVDAYSFHADNVPFILVNTATSRLRRRACECHELGHLVLHNTARDSDMRTKEMEADVFAASFLMPEEPFLQGAPSTHTIDAIDEARRTWGVTATAYLRRLRDLEAIPEWRYRDLSAASRLRDESTDPALAGDPDKSPFLERWLASTRDGIPGREAAAACLRVHLPDLDAITFASSGPMVA
ncbi:MAG: ImmA/IrrE family metallo-endopeptidase [Gemmatimonadetes bacterium]|nr:ImmA/IrrE family metallo-endopeptidase [Gemmatimonadota bacterium]